MAKVTNMASSSSPHSSDGATHHETPSTNLTAFSPETVSTINSSARAQPKFNLRVTTNGQMTTNSVLAIRSGGDIFLNEPAAATAVSHLSPVAETFTPGQYLTPRATNTSTGGVAAIQAVNDQVARYWRGIGQGISVSNLLPDSIPDDAQGIVGYLEDVFHPHHLTNTPLPPLPDLLAECNDMITRMNMTMSAATTPPTLQTIVITEGTFSTEERRGRAVLISGIPTDFPELSIRTIFNQQQWNSILGISFKDLKQHGVVVVGFSGIGDAAEIQPYIKNIQPNWTVRRISPKQYAQQTTGLYCDMVSDHEGQLIITIFYDGTQKLFLAGPVITALKQTLNTYGYLKAFHSLPAGQQHARDFRVEFEDTRSAQNALTSLHEVQFENFVVTIERYHPDICTVVSMPLGRPAPRQMLSVTGRSTVPVPDGFNFHGEDLYQRNLYNSPPRRGRDRYDSNGNHNQVIIPKIEVGLDVRTTIMLRNIPNKVDSAMLKKILDETSHGAYDFMYLRIDFANNCNVGYAFINFVDALAIIPFALARAGQRWNKFGSDKVAEISYATIQGKDCLVQKFRNSSVMLEHPTFRPKLFTTGSVPDAGKEEPFPGPDNVSKMRRSVENAEHVGLFIPTRNTSPPASLSRYFRLRTAGSLPHAPARSVGSTNLHALEHGTYLTPANATLRSMPALDAVETPLSSSTQALTDAQYARDHFSRPRTQTSTRPILTPSTSVDSLYSQAIMTPTSSTSDLPSTINTARTDDPFAGARTIRCPNALTSPTQRLFAPRQGQAYREEQRRRRSQYDRGTPGAEQEASSNRLQDPALSPSHNSYTPRPTGYGSNNGGFGHAYGFDMSTPRPGYGTNIGGFGVAPGPVMPMPRPSYGYH